MYVMWGTHTVTAFGRIWRDVREISPLVIPPPLSPLERYEARYELVGGYMDGKDAMICRYIPARKGGRYLRPVGCWRAAGKYWLIFFLSHF